MALKSFAAADTAFPAELFYEAAFIRLECFLAPVLLPVFEVVPRSPLF